jgi:hypothetical protein
VRPRYRKLPAPRPIPARLFALHCETCQLLGNCRQRLTLGLYVGCETPDEHDLETMRSLSDEQMQRAEVLLSVQLQFAPEVEV